MMRALLVAGLVASACSPSSPMTVEAAQPSQAPALAVNAPGPQVDRVAVRAVPTRSRAEQDRLLETFTTYFEPMRVTLDEPTSLASLSVSRCGRVDTAWIRLLRTENQLPADVDVPAGVALALPACPYWTLGGTVTIDPGETVSGEVYRQMGQWGPNTQDKIRSLNDKQPNWDAVEATGATLQVPYRNARISYVLRPQYQGSAAKVAAAIDGSNAVVKAIKDDELRLVSETAATCVDGAAPPFDEAVLAVLLAKNAARRTPRLAVVGVIDTGVSEGELSRLFLNRGSDSSDGADKNRDEDGNGFVDDTYGTNIATRRGFPATASSYSLHGHGTHVAGLALGGLRSDALKQQVKPRIEVRVINLVTERPTLGASNQVGYDFSIPLTNLIDAVAYARKDPPIPILNLSVETGRRPDVFEKAGLGEYLAIVAAGNSGEDIVDQTPYYPAASSLEFPKIVLTVGALAPDGTLAPFSNRGGAAVAIAAPGCNVESTLPDGKTGPMSGTSQAAPQVTFAAALLYSEGFAIDKVRNRLLASTVRDDRLGDLVGYGRLDVIRALKVNDDVVTLKGEAAPLEGLIQSPSCLNIAGSCLGWDRVLRIQATPAGLLVYSQNNGGQLQVRTAAVPSGVIKFRIGDTVRDVPWADVTDVLVALRRPAT